jgi:hypothetical protein
LHHQYVANRTAVQTQWHGISSDLPLDVLSPDADHLGFTL